MDDEQTRLRRVPAVKAQDLTMRGAITWQDLELAALFDPFLQRMMTRVRRGDLSREDALIETVAALVKVVDEYRRADLARQCHNSPAGGRIRRSPRSRVSSGTSGPSGAGQVAPPDAGPVTH